MSNEYTIPKNKQHKIPKIRHVHYLKNYHEPLDDMSNDSPAGLEAELVENSFFMRRKFRHIAQKIRNLYT